MKTITTQLTNSINHSRVPAYLLISFVLACLALSPTARAVTPAPDGGYPGQNTAEGEDALFSLTTGTDNSALGFHALFSNTIFSQNTAVGSDALASNSASFNTAVGFRALYGNTSGEFNTAIGDGALWYNTVGNNNTASGFSALLHNTRGQFNTATGVEALFENTTGHDNTATGLFALLSNITGSQNTADGVQALQSNLEGNANTASGFYALISNQYGNHNTAVGFSALYSNTTGNNNIALGADAGSNLTMGSNNIDIGSKGLAGESNTIRIGKNGTQTTTHIAGISGATVPTGVAVIVDANGHLGTTTCSARFKDAIKPMDQTSEVILAFKPVTFRYKPELDPEGIPQFGLVAEEVAKVNPDLVMRDHQGKPYTVRYEAVNVMLLNEFIKEHRTVQEQKTTIDRLQSCMAQQETEIEALKAALKEQASQIHKVSAELVAASSSFGGLEARKFATGRIRRGGPSPQIVVGNH